MVAGARAGRRQTSGETASTETAKGAEKSGSVPGSAGVGAGGVQGSFLEASEPEGVKQVLLKDPSPEPLRIQTVTAFTSKPGESWETQGRPRAVLDCAGCGQSLPRGRAAAGCSEGLGLVCLQSWQAPVALNHPAPWGRS